jgi:outer membrane protein assembly factor BamA
MAWVTAQLLLGIYLASSLFQSGAGATHDVSLTLSRVDVIGTTRLSSEDVAAGLHLKVGKEITRDELTRACATFTQLNLFYSARCKYEINKNVASLSISVKNDSPNLPVVFQNFVWTTRAELLKRLKQEIPLFMPDLPEETGLTNDIIRVLEKVAREHGIDHKVLYNSFWSERGMFDFRLEGISTPVVSLQIEGENAPSPEEIWQQFSGFYRREDYSAPRLTWVIGWLVRDFYFTRGYMRPVVGQARLENLDKKDGAYPVRIIVPITSGKLYTFDSVSFEGLAQSHSSELLAKWKLNRGEPYNESYKDKFISDEILTQPWAQESNAKSRSVSYCSLADKATMTVSVIIGVDEPDMWSKIKPGQQCAGSYSTLVSPPVP